MTLASDWRDAPLSGRLLVEASAGTGKTWAMAALYLRLLLDGREGATTLTPERIVVATYTDAAAQELGERLRARVTQALQATHAGTSGVFAAADPVGDWLASRWREDAVRATDRARLLAALAKLDHAPIGTLHGLCHRLLLEHPLAGGFGFSPPKLGDGRRVHEAIARDLLRRIGAGDAPPQARILPDRLRRIDDLVAAIGFLLQPGAVVAPVPDEADLRARIDPVTGMALRALADPANYTQARAKALKTALALLAFLDHGGEAPDDIDALCGGRGINRWVREPAAARLRDPGFQQAMAGLAAALARRTSPERAFWAWWAPELRRLREARSAELGELGFDPLIERVRNVMEAPDGALADAAFARWPVALVDEFQDTDGTQYALLDRWFRDRNGAPRGLLAMVGDPKQAIYGFRGGDVGAYLRARTQATATLRLGVNQRSSRAYVAACNTLFGGERALLSADPAHPIHYAAVGATDRAEATRLHEYGVAVERPLVIHRHPVPDWNARARPRAIEACADLVVDLLEPGRLRFGATGPALAPGDIAVLLRTNAEIDDLRRALLRRRVPCAGQSRQQVFDTPSARDLLLVLHAMQHPGDLGALRAALLTPLFGLPLAELPAFEANGGFDAWREHFIDWRQRWQREGVLAAALAVLDAARPALAGQREAERIATDLRHLGELLQARESEGHAPATLLDWLRAQRHGEDDDAQEERGSRSLRLESDARRVRLMTLHASKGLEFPVVLLPTLWGHEARRAEGAALAPADAHGQREALFETEALKALGGEQQDERFRLLYVALTRAVHACHLFVLPEGRPAKKPPAKSKAPPKPKRDPDRSALDALLERWPESERTAAGIDWRAHWPLPPDSPFEPAAHADNDAAVVPAISTKTPLPGPFTLPGRWSFSQLTRGREARTMESAAADDESPPAAYADDPAATEAALADADRARIDASLAELAEVGGIPFGNALHELLESATPGQRFSDDPERVQATLARHAVRSAGTTPMPVIAQRVAARLDRVLQTPLALLPPPSVPRRLATLVPEQRRAELSFHFVLGETSLRALRTICARHGEPHLVPPGAVDRLSGWMEGSIDLVLEHAGRAHVLDWKSNALAHAEAATPAALVGLMDHHHYRFQALLYTVALHRLLRQRLGDRYRIAAQLGAPVYVFLRAVGLAPGLGVWQQRFPDALIEAVDAALAGDRA